MSYKGFTFSGFTSKLNGFQWSKPVVEEPSEKLEHPKEFKQLLKKLHILKNVQSNLIKITQTAFPGCKKTSDINTMRDTLNNLSHSLTNGFNYSPTKDENGKHEKKGSVSSNSSFLNHSKSNSVSQETTTPYHTMALAFVDCGLDIGVEETLGAALYKVATIQQKIGDALITMESVLAANFIEPLMLNVDTNIKFIEKTCNQVDQALQVLNTIKNKYDLAGENASEELKSEFIVAQDSYNNSIEQAKSLIHNVIESPETIKRLLELISSQMEYHKEAYQLLSDILPQLNDMVATESMLKNDNSSHEDNNMILTTNNINREPSIISSNSLEPSQPEIQIIESSFNDNSAPYFNPFSKATTSTDAIHTVAHDSSEEHINSELVNENLNTRDIYLPDILKSSNNSIDEGLHSEPDFAYSDHSNINNETQPNLMANIYKNEIQSTTNDMETPDLTVDYNISESQEHSSLNNHLSLIAESSNLQDMELPNSNLNVNDVILNEDSLPETYNNINEELEVPRQFMESSTPYDSIFVKQETSLNETNDSILEDADLNKEIIVSTVINDQVNQNDEDDNLNNNEFEFIPTPLEKIDEITEDEGSNIIINHMDFENEEGLEDDIINDKQVNMEDRVLNNAGEKIIEENEINGEMNLDHHVLNQVINKSKHAIEEQVVDKGFGLKDKISNDITEAGINEVEIELNQNELFNTIDEAQKDQFINHTIENEQDQVIEKAIDSNDVIENALNESKILPDVIEKDINENNEEDLKEQVIDEAKQDLNQHILNQAIENVIDNSQVALDKDEVKHIINLSELNLDDKVLNQVIEEVLNEDEVTLKQDQDVKDVIEKGIDQSEQDLEEDKISNEVIENTLSDDKIGLIDVVEDSLNELELKEDKVLSDVIEAASNDNEEALKQDGIINDIAEKAVNNEIELEENKRLDSIVNEENFNHEKDSKEDLITILSKDIQSTQELAINEEEVKEEILNDNNSINLNNSVIENDSLSLSMFNNISNDNNKLEDGIIEGKDSESISAENDLIRVTHAIDNVDDSNFIIEEEDSDIDNNINEQIDAKLYFNLNQVQKEIDNEDNPNKIINTVLEEHVDSKEELYELKSDTEKVIGSKEDFNEIQVNELQSINNVINHIVDKELLSEENLQLGQGEYVLSKEIDLNKEGSLNDVINEDMAIEEAISLEDSVNKDEVKINDLDNFVETKEQLDVLDQVNSIELEERVISSEANELLEHVIGEEKDNIDIEKEISNVLEKAIQQEVDDVDIENKGSNVAESEIDELLDQVNEKEVKNITIENKNEDLINEVIKEQVKDTNIEYVDNIVVENEINDLMEQVTEEGTNKIATQNENNELLEQVIEKEKENIDNENDKQTNLIIEDDINDLLERIIEEEKDSVSIENEINGLLEEAIEQGTDKFNVEEQINESIIENGINDLLEQTIEEKTNELDIEDKDSKIDINNLYEINSSEDKIDVPKLILKKEINDIQRELDNKLKSNVQNTIEPLDKLNEEDEILKEVIKKNNIQLDLDEGDIINKGIEVKPILEDELDLIIDDLEDAGINIEDELSSKVEENKDIDEVDEIKEELDTLNSDLNNKFKENADSNSIDEVSKQSIEDIKQESLNEQVEKIIKKELELELNDAKQTTGNESKDAVLSTLDSLDFNSDFNLNTGLLNGLNQHELQSESDFSGIEKDNGEDLDFEMDLTTEDVNQEQENLIAKISNSDNELNYITPKENGHKKASSLSIGINNTNSTTPKSPNSIKQFNLKSHKKSNSVLNKFANFEKEVISSNTTKVNDKLKSPGLKTSFSERLSKFEKS